MLELTHKPLREIEMTITEQLAAYGYTLQDNQIVSPEGKATGVYVSEKKARIHCRAADSRLLWSGPRVADFLEAFWFATPCKHDDATN